MDCSNVITKNQCRKVLERYTGSKDFQIKSYTVSPLGSLDGLMCEQYFLKISYQIGDEDTTVQFFFKILTEANPVIYGLSRSFCVYEKESFYYETVIPLLKSRGLSGAYAPKCYFSHPFIIVLEDLTLRSFKGFGKSKPLDLEHCKKGLETLAKFHVEPIMYELERSKELGNSYSLASEFSNILQEKYLTDRESCASKFVQCSVRGLFHLVDLVPENGVSKSEFKAALEEILQRMLTITEESMGFRSTLLHGDLWSNNFLYQYDQVTNEITDCAVIDFQFLRYGPPAFDVLQFLFTNTRKAFRDQHQSELVAHYYQFFSDLLVQNGFDPTDVLSEDEFKGTCEACSVIVKTLAVMDRSITVISDENYADATKDDEEFSRYLYEDRGKYVVRGFTNNREFRELMIEDLTELRDMIFSKQCNAY